MRFVCSVPIELSRTDTSRPSGSPMRMLSALAALVAMSATAHAGELSEATAANTPGLARALLSSGQNPNDADADGTTALHWAAHHDDVELAMALLEAGADARAANRYGVRPIFLAAENGSASMIRLLLRFGADANARLPAGEPVLMTTARTGDVAALRALIDNGADVKARDGWKGQTALMWAAADNHADAVSYLVDVGAAVDAVSDSGEYSALKFAVRAGAIDATRALIEAGADVEQRMADGTSMLVLAVTNAHYELADVLLEAGADPNAADQGWTALHQIAWSRRWNRGFNLPGPVRTGDLDGLALARSLVRHGADIDARQTAEPKDGNRNKLDRIGATAFLLAAKAADVPLMRELLELGANPSITTREGTTALMAAAGVGIWAPGENPGTHEEALAAVKLAYAAGGGAVDDVNASGDTALHGAVYRGGAVPVIEFLVERGARLDAVNVQGWTPVFVADGVEYTPDVLKRYPEAAAVLRRLRAEQGLEVPESTQPGRGLLSSSGE
jgi:ankyrin repeat protein